MVEVAGFIRSLNRRGFLSRGRRLFRLTRSRRYRLRRLPHRGTASLTPPRPFGPERRLFRPPFGEFDVAISAPARAEGMEICIWSIDSHDWDWAYDEAGVMKRITKNVGPDTIILFHLDGYHTLKVLPDAVKYYREDLDLEFVPITELMAMGGLELPDCPCEE